MSTKLPEIEQRVKEAWPSEPVALEVLRVVSAIDLELSHYITIPLVVQRIDDLRGVPIATHAGDKVMITFVYKLVEYLASEPIGLLDPHFELLLRNEDQPVEIDRRTVIDAFRSGELHDPKTGNPIPDWEAQVIPYYSATDLLKDILRERE